MLQVRFPIYFISLYGIYLGIFTVQIGYEFSFYGLGFKFFCPGLEHNDVLKCWLLMCCFLGLQERDTEAAVACFSC